MKQFFALPVFLILAGLVPVKVPAVQASEQNAKTPILKVLPNNGEFSGVQLSEDLTRSFTITNAGVSVLKIKNVEVSGACFTLIDTTHYPYEVIADSGFAYSVGNSGKSIRFSVKFKPADIGVFTGMIKITYGLWSDESYEIPLSGEGVSCGAAIVAVKGENHASKQNVWYQYTADKYSIVDINACHPNQVNNPSNPYRLIYFYVYLGCDGPLIPEVEEWRGLCTYDRQVVPVWVIMKAGQTIKIYFPMVNSDSPYAKNGFYFNINVTYPVDGDVCENAIPLTLPVVNHFGNTRGLQDDYNYSPCSVYPNYMDGNDKVYTVTLPEEGYLTGNILGAYASIHVLDVCPVSEITKDHCKAFVGGPNGGQFRKKIAAGTYYVIISNWAPPQTLDYLLNMSWEGVSGVTDDDLRSSLNVFPNPARDKFTVSLNCMAPADLTLDLANVSGQVVYHREIKDAYGFQEDIDVRKLPGGVYYLRVNNGRELVIKKVVIE